MYVCVCFFVFFCFLFLFFFLFCFCFCFFVFLGPEEGKSFIRHPQSRQCRDSYRLKPPLVDSPRNIQHPPELFFSITSVGLILVPEDFSSKAVFLSLSVFSSHFSLFFFFGPDCPPNKGSYPVPTVWRLEHGRNYVVCRQQRTDLCCQFNPVLLVSGAHEYRVFPVVFFFFS